ncbi:MAG: hypothetical protein JWM86_2991, partial [Thermoleophilia bacterium]|nr:hypothetical protein [Thermoleophilia bacterium]
MPGPIVVSQIAEAAVRMRPRPAAAEAIAGAAQEMLPGFAAIEQHGASSLGDLLGQVLHPTLDFGGGGAGRPTVVLVGIGRTPPLTTQSIIEQAAKRGLIPGEDVIATRYADLRVGKDRGFVRLADGTGEGGRVLAGQGKEALFLFRGGGNLKEHHLRKIGMIQAVEGATALADRSFIERAGSKAITYDKLHAAGLALADTSPVHGADEAITAFERITGRFGADTAVLKKVNSLG